MSIEHKAFIFDYNAFVDELADILKDALINNENEKLINFIEDNLLNLKHPDEGDPLDCDWQKTIEIEDASQYGDLAITKYYNPNWNIGIGYNWQELDDAIFSKLDLNISPLLGIRLGTTEKYFDPGKLGSYFQSPDLVRINLELLNSLSIEKQEYLESICLLQEMFSIALTLIKGIYITF